MSTHPHNSLSRSGSNHAHHTIRACLNGFCGWIRAFPLHCFSRASRLVVRRQNVSHTCCPRKWMPQCRVLAPPAPESHTHTHRLTRGFTASRESMTTRTTREWVHLRIGPTSQKKIMYGHATRRDDDDDDGTTMTGSRNTPFLHHPQKLRRSLLCSSVS